ncbi:MAG: RNA-binding domain-containing protein [Candidatus Thalassarchaeaceae archaeon]
MSLHSVNWRIHCSAVDDIENIESAMSQLSPIKTEITREKSKSYHGAPQIILAMKINNKKAAKQSVQLLGTTVLNQIVSNGLESKIDGDKVFHVRLSLSSLVSGKILLAEGSEWKSAVKGQYKIEAYPGQKPSEVLSDLISKFE